MGWLMPARRSPQFSGGPQRTDEDDVILSATVRVRLDGDSASGKPSPTALHDTAALLTELGFHVLNVGRFGVSIEGEAKEFSRVLGVDLEQDKPLVAEVHPQDPKLQTLIDLIEATPKPKLF
jgi:hypothetical protein